MSFCSLIKGITSKICMLCFFQTDGVLLNFLCFASKNACVFRSMGRVLSKFHYCYYKVWLALLRMKFRAFNTLSELFAVAALFLFLVQHTE